MTGETEINTELTMEESIRARIYTVRGAQVMLDRDLAELYGTETKLLNRAVKRNIERFPEEFMFQLTEHENLRFQIGTSSDHGGRRYLPYAFTEQGVAMLSAVLPVIEISQCRIAQFLIQNRHIYTSTGCRGKRPCGMTRDHPYMRLTCSTYIIVFLNIIPDNPMDYIIRRVNSRSSEVKLCRGRNTVEAA